MADIVDIDTRRPHFTIPTEDGDCHVMPVILVQRVARGELPLSDIGDGPIRQILSEWLADRGC